jgi:hypothetical protein
MSSEGGITLPNNSNKIIQSPKSKDFARNITHNTQIPYIKIMVNILKLDGTCFS